MMRRFSEEDNLRSIRLVLKMWTLPWRRTLEWQASKCHACRGGVGSCRGGGGKKLEPEIVRCVEALMMDCFKF
jgi:hypothetical protein